MGGSVDNGLYVHRLRCSVVYFCLIDVMGVRLSFWLVSYGREHRARGGARNAAIRHKQILSFAAAGFINGINCDGNDRSTAQKRDYRYEAEGLYYYRKSEGRLRGP